MPSRIASNENEVDGIRSGLPRSSQELSNDKATFSLSLAILAVIGYTFSRFARIYVIILPPLLGPVLAGFYFVFRPLDPFRGIFARLEAFERNDVHRAESARPLLQVLESGSAKRIGILSGTAIGLMFAGVNVLVAETLHKVSLSFDPMTDPAWILIGTFLTWAASMGILAQVLLRWAFRRLGTQ